MRVEKDLWTRIHHSTQVKHRSDSKERLFVVRCLLLLLCKRIEATLRRRAGLLRGKLAVLRLAKARGYVVSEQHQVTEKKVRRIPEGADISERIDTFTIARCK
jgi:hypothetical protein